MKVFPAILSILIVLFTRGLSAHAQGTITFGNNIPEVLNAPIYGAEFQRPGTDWANAKSGNSVSGFPVGSTVYNGSLLENYFVGFWAIRTPGIRDGHLLGPSAMVVPLGSGSNAGYFQTTNVTFSFLPEFGWASVQVRVWKASRGSDPSKWLQYGGESIIDVGASDIFTVRIGEVADGFRSFSLGWLSDKSTPTLIPEPSTSGILAMAMAVLTWRRVRL